MNTTDTDLFVTNWSLTSKARAYELTQFRRGDDPQARTNELIRLAKIEALNEAIALIRQDECAGESLYASGVMAARERHIASLEYLISRLEPRQPYRGL
jgi:hypothetical protein